MARKSGKYVKKAYLNGDVLRINQKDYTVHDLEKLPADLHPRKLSFKSDNDYIVFGGIHSQFNFLSNFATLDANWAEYSEYSAYHSTTLIKYLSIVHNRTVIILTSNSGSQQEEELFVPRFWS